MTRLTKVYYDDYSNGCGQVIVPRAYNRHDKKEDLCDECIQNEEKNCKEDDKKNDICCKKSSQFPFLEGLLPNLKLDDIILLAIILIFLHDGCEDKTLLVVVGIIFLLGFND